MKFVDADGEFDVEAYRYAARLTLTAQEILVDNASYPTPRIEENSHKFRPLGLGYANLGALLMSRGLAYDSDEGRNFAAGLTAIMHGEAYRQSSVIARDHGGPFLEYDVNQKSFLRVIGKHRDAAYALPTKGVPIGVLEAAVEVFDEALELGKDFGYRNAQVTVLAPTGTIAFMMDCDTTGIEPDIALIKYKKLVGEGFLKIVNQTVPAALRKLGYSADETQAILDHINDHETIEGAPGLKPEHLPVFDCAFKPVNGERSIHYMGHVRMMSAVQPFISGAISKTVNMPEAATAEEIEQVYLEGWKLGLKAIAIYRDGSKRSQPLSTGKKKDEGSAEQQAAHQAAPGAARRLAGRGGQAAPPPAPGRAHRGHAQVRHRRPRGLHHRRAVPRRPARRDLPEDGEGRLDRLRPHGLVRHDGLGRAPVRRPAPRPGEQVRARPLRAQRVHGQLGDPDRQVAGGLHLPVDGVALPVRRRQVGPRADRSRLARSTRPARRSPDRSASLRQLGGLRQALRWLMLRPTRSVRPPIRSPLRRTAGDQPKASAVAAAQDLALNVEPAPRVEKVELGYLATVGASNGHANGHTNGHANGNAPKPPNGGGISLNLGGTKVAFATQADAPSCMDCGSIMVRNGSCYKCLNCGSTSGCS